MPNSFRVELIFRVRHQSLKVFEPPVESTSPALVSNEWHIAYLLQIALQFYLARVISSSKLDQKTLRMVLRLNNFVPFSLESFNFSLQLLLFCFGILARFGAFVLYGQQARG